VQEIVIGMAHRGRLNVLVNSLGKVPADLFAEFDHTAPEDLPSGDVKYHQGFSSDVTTPGGPVHLTLAFNPSHLEIVNPVVEGSVRARMDRRADPQGMQVLPVLVHGDAAFAGQGVVMETLALAETRGYFTGGTVHIVINNQIGFTTSDPRDSRSTLYCTDVVKMIEAPVLHVNGDDPEAVVLATQLALEFRMEFHKDVVVDIICFRKLGHNEQDTPALTQPLMYKKIAQHPGTRRLYADKLTAQGMGDTLGDDMVKATRAALDAGKSTFDPVLTNFKSKYAVDWALPGQEVDRRRRHGHPHGRVEAPGRQDHRHPRHRDAAPAGQEGVRRPRSHGPRRHSRWTGAWASTWHLPRWSPAATLCACRAKTAAAAPSRTATP
jgi:2-oxoglutarate dehydrogenase E1 component